MRSTRVLVLLLLLAVPARAATIVSGASSDVLTIGPTSKAARVELYDAAGNVLMPKVPIGSYMAPIEIRQTAATATAAAVWAMRAAASGATKLYLRRIWGVVGFDGTATATTTLRYTFRRFSGGNYSSGTAITIIKKRNADGASSVQDIREVDTGLTVGSAAVEAPFATVSLPLSAAGTIAGTGSAVGIPFDLRFDQADQTFAGMEFIPGASGTAEGLVITIGGLTSQAAIIGQSIMGMVEWDER